MSTAINDFGDRALNYSAPNCFDLPVLRATDSDGQRICVSCWQFDAEQLAQINANGGKVYLHVWGGNQPPVYVSQHNPIDTMTDVDTLRQQLENEVNALRPLYTQLHEVVTANGSADHLQELANTIEQKNSLISTLAWVLNLKLKIK